ncbi:hypothetical protein Zmor_027111 [Zophobas morio]|jgi:hypothetical protein|uniref:Uncharacterized protein n=1 Tax=Zophobas morio TaxID=2755281 RepID=A0AA38HJN5_9CUCU|nr:hypothetical protein Zmor_027111 [Zophobas morio]
MTSARCKSHEEWITRAVCAANMPNLVNCFFNAEEDRACYLLKLKALLVHLAKRLSGRMPLPKFKLKIGQGALHVNDLFKTTLKFI